MIRNNSYNLVYGKIISSDSLVLIIGFDSFRI